MISTKPGFLPLALAATLALGGCATTTPAPARGDAVTSQEAIRWSIGPCFGFCPVYSVTVAANGTVTFDGDRHTAVIGRRVRSDRADAFRVASSLLTRFKPAGQDAAELPCDRRTSDQSVTQIIWTAPDGSTSTLTYDRGCHSERNDALGAALQALPTKLGIETWTRQVTRPDASRG